MAKVPSLPDQFQAEARLSGRAVVTSEKLNANTVQPTHPTTTLVGRCNP